MAATSAHDGAMQDQTHGFAVSAGLPQAAKRLFIGFGIASAIALVAVIAAGVFGPRLLQSTQSTLDTPLQIIIGNEVLSVSENMVWHAGQRRPGVAERIDLYLYWPERSGFTRALIAEFADTNPVTTQVAIISIAKRQGFLDMAARFQPVYSKASDRNATVYASDGLHAKPLNPALGYIDETLFFAAPGAYADKPAFIARCNDPASGTSALLLACEMDLFFGGNLEAKVRFPASFLEQWRVFGPELTTFLDELVVPDSSL